MKTTTKLRLIGGLVLIFNLWLIGNYNLKGIPVFLMTFGFALGYEFLCVRPASKKAKKTYELHLQHQETLRRSELDCNGTILKQDDKGPPNVFSWKTILIAFLATFIISIIAAAANPGLKSRGVHWTLVWMVFTVEGWKYWRWKSLIPYPSYLFCASLTSVIAGLLGLEISDVRTVNSALNVVSVTIFAILYYRRFRKHKLEVIQQIKPEVKKGSFFCPYCSKEILAESVFCHKCGNKLPKIIDNTEEQKDDTSRTDLQETAFPLQQKSSNIDLLNKNNIQLSTPPYDQFSEELKRIERRTSARIRAMYPSAFNRVSDEETKN